MGTMSTDESPIVFNIIKVIALSLLPAAALDLPRLAMRILCLGQPPSSMVLGILLSARYPVPRPDSQFEIRH